MARVLLVEDEFLIAEVVGAALRDEGLEVAIVNSAPEAVARLEAEPRSFAALVTDINLGAITDGFDVAQCARDLNPAVKVVYMTGKSSNLRAACADAPTFPKPFSVLELADHVRMLVGRN